MTIGVFDSGVGGLSVANAIEAAMPDHDILYLQDKKNVPYGMKTPEELLKLVVPILHSMVEDGCSVIVIACNSVSTTILNELRRVVQAEIIEVEPLLGQAAALTKSKVIAVCATPATLGSPRYKQLRSEHAANMTVLEPDCSEWAYLIETDRIDRTIIKNHIANVCQQGADVIVLGCTHYHWIEGDIREVANKFNAHVIQPEKDIIARLRVAIERHG
jgi:glutamate racemase